MLKTSMEQRRMRRKVSETPIKRNRATRGGTHPTKHCGSSSSSRYYILSLIIIITIIILASNTASSAKFILGYKYQSSSFWWFWFCATATAASPFSTLFRFGIFFRTSRA
jgi:hypothetical protein